MKAHVKFSVRLHGVNTALIYLSWKDFIVPVPVQSEEYFVAESQWASILFRYVLQHPACWVAVAQTSSLKLLRKILVSKAYQSKVN